MEIKELNYLIAIYEEKSISHAAERLFMAQSSLSQYLKVLEAQIGSPLFYRTSTGVRPTQAGEILVNYAYTTLSEYHRTTDMIQDIHELKGGRVIMGISTFRGTFLLPPILNAYKMKYPDIQVILVEENSVVLEQLLIKGDLDIAILMLPLSKLDTPTDFMMRDEICLIASPNHPINDIAKPFPESVLNRTDTKIERYIEIEDAMEYDFLLSEADAILGREARRVFREHNLTPKCSNEKLSAFLSASMAASGLGIAFTYYCSHRFFTNASYISLGKDRFMFDLGIAMPPGRYHSKATLALRDTILDVFTSRT